jgi:hypothetical protein
MDVIVFKNDQGSLSVLSTLLDIVDAVKIHNLTDYIIVDDSLLPIEPIESWVLTNGEIKVNPHKLIEFNRLNLQQLTKRQFSLYLYDIGKYEQVMDALNANPRFKIEFETVSIIERNSPTVTAMGQILEWDDLTIDEKWNEALKL